MNRERLQKIADFLRDLPPEKFDIGLWVSDVDQHLKCGMVCCAAGWFPKIFPEDWEYTDEGWYPQLRSKKFVINYSLVANYLDISEGKALDLFDPEEYPNRDDTTKEEVIERIEDLLASS